MTDPSAAREPVTLDEMIAWLRRDIKKLEGFATAHAAHAYERDLEIERAAVATLQQHKRAMAVVEAARKVCAGHRLQSLLDAKHALHEALATFDTAEPSGQGT